jgi:acyl-coenzyme A synthetase/AMP-(fatty) acid ligase
MLTHSGVAKCAVVGVPHPDWGEELQAFVPNDRHGQRLACPS